jgi:methanethiol S-methyltransferase
MALTRAKAPGGPRAFIGLLYGILTYLIFLGVFLVFAAFIENAVLPTTLDVGRSSSTLRAALVDVGLLTLFALQHSVMARGGFKAWLTRTIPASVERSTFVLVSSLLLALIVWGWQPLTGVVWNVTNSIGRWALIGLSFAGIGIVLLSTFLLNHFEFFGLRQVVGAWRGWPRLATTFRTPLLYRVVRHPLMLGFLIAFWAAPLMTVGHVIFAGFWTVYIVLSVRWLEEPDLAAAIGEPYRAYQRQVPMLLPWSFRARKG